MTQQNPFALRIGDVEDILATVRYMNEAISMSAVSIADDNQRNAIQAVAYEIDNKLLVVRDRLDEIRGQI